MRNITLEVEAEVQSKKIYPAFLLSFKEVW